VPKKQRVSNMAEEVWSAEQGTAQPVPRTRTKKRSRPSS
jgi:hypothetical protein